MQHQGGNVTSCKVENVVKVENATSKYKMQHCDKICFRCISVLESRSLKLLMESINGAKFFSRACIKAK